MSSVAAVATIIIVETFKMTNLRFWAVRKLGAKMVKKIKITIITPNSVIFLASIRRLKGMLWFESAADRSIIGFLSKGASKF
jgi:hypothetical protein